MSFSKSSMIARTEAYFRDVDAFDTDAILSHLTDDVVFHVPTDGVVRDGKAAVRQTFDNRAGVVKESWHGDFVFMADAAEGRLAVRDAVRRINADGSPQEMDNMTLLEFEGDLIRRITVWMTGPNPLT